MDAKVSQATASTGCGQSVKSAHRGLQDERKLTNRNPVSCLCVGLLQRFVDRDTSTEDRSRVVQLHSVRDFAEMIDEGHRVLLERAINLGDCKVSARFAAVLADDSTYGESRQFGFRA